MSAFSHGGQADLPESSDPASPLKPGYHTFGCAVVEVEVEVLTGERRVSRADVMFDLGRPANPAVDVGQVGGWGPRGYRRTTGQVGGGPVAMALGPLHGVASAACSVTCPIRVCACAHACRHLPI